MQVNSVFVLVGIYPVDLSLIYTSNTIEDRKDFVIHTETMGEGIQYKQIKKNKSLILQQSVLSSASFCVSSSRHLSPPCGRALFTQHSELPWNKGSSFINTSFHLENLTQRKY